MADASWAEEGMNETGPDAQKMGDFWQDNVNLEVKFVYWPRLVLSHMNCVGSPLASPFASAQVWLRLRPGAVLFR